jgi:hypothetical protein
MSVKTWVKWGVVLSSLVAVQACGGGGEICDRLEEVGQDIQACSGVDSDENNDGDTDELESCEAALKSCTDEDKAKYNAFFDCYEKAGSCDKDAYQEWLTKASACTAQLEGLSDNCAGVQ